MVRSALDSIFPKPLSRYAPKAKPSYRVPSMKEVARVKPSGLRIVSTFSGCGGSCLGFEMAGYRVLWANEFVPAAAEVYRLNHPKVVLNIEDVRALTPEKVCREAGVEPGDVDVMEGSPPCASFSMSGDRAETWGKVKAYSDTRQRTDDLFFEFVRLVAGVRPKVFVAENVSGLVKGVAKGYFKEILRAMQAAGYAVECRVLDAQWLGVPQVRQRTIFVGVRSDLERAPTFPKPLPYRYSVRDAIGDLADVETIRDRDRGRGDRFRSGELPMLAVTSSERQDYRPVVRTKRGARSAELPAPTVQTHGRRKTHSELSIEDYAIGPEAARLRPGEQSDRYFNLVRPDEVEPSPTVTAVGGSSKGTASVIHPTESRKFTIDELKRICGFPDDFVLTGTYAQQWERLGRAVPPPMMAAVARAIREGVFGK